MDKIIEKSFDIITKSVNKLPLAFMFLLIFILLFPVQGKFIIEQSLTLFSSILPASIKLFLSGITLKYVINFFGATLIISLISLIWEIAFKIYQNPKEPINLEMNFLFQLNSIGLISLIIYNKVSNSPISIHTINKAIEPSTVYSLVLVLSFFTFLIIFSTIYLFFLWALFIRILDIENVKLRIIMFLLFFVFLFILLNYIDKEVLQSMLGSTENIV